MAPQHENASTESVETALRLPSDVGDCYQLAVSAHRARDFARAIGHYNRAIALDPGNLMALFNRGRARTAAGDYWRRRRDIEYALDYVPLSADTLFSAASDFAQSITSAPDWHQPWLNRAIVGILITLVSEGTRWNWQSVVSDLNKAVSLCGRDGTPFFYRALLGELAGHDPRSVEADLERCLTVGGGPESVTQIRRGIFWHRLGAKSHYLISCELRSGCSSC